MSKEADFRKDMNGEKKQENKTSKFYYFLIPFLLIVVGFLVYKYVLGGAMLGGGDLGGSTPEESLGNFFEAQQKHGTFTYIKKNSDGEIQPEQTGEFWVKGQNFRRDYYRSDGDLRISIISYEGKAYFCRPATKACTPAVSPLESYLLAYYKPSENVEELGRDEEYDCTNFRYTIQETYNIEGSSNPWYNEDITYCLNKDELKKSSKRGRVKKIFCLTNSAEPMF